MATNGHAVMRRLRVACVAVGALVGGALLVAAAPKDAVPLPQTITYEADNSIFANPERGFFQAFNPPYDGKQGGQEKNHPPFDKGKLHALREAPERITLVRDDILIPKKFWTEPLSPEYLAGLQADFDAVRDGGQKVIIRFLYDWSMNNRDPDEATIKSHLEQLKPLLERNGDVIAWVQAGLFGGCGEGCRSDHGYVQDVHPAPKSKLLWAGLSDAGGRLYQQELAMIPKDRMMTIRYPRLKWDLLGWTADNAAQHFLKAEGAFDGSDAARIGFYNEGFMGDENHYGMFQLPGERECVANDSLYTVHEGEISNASPYKLKKKQALVDMKAFHQTALNCGGDQWDKVQKAWKDNGDYDEICRRLGYRLRLVQASLVTDVAAGGELAVDLQMKNEGFAAVMNPRGVELILQNSDDNKIYVASFDAGRGNRRWFPAPDETRDLHIAAGIPKDLPPGEYDLYLNLPDPAPRLHDRPEYAIRLANKNAWDDSTGWNNLQAGVTVSAPAGKPYGGATWFAARQAAAVPAASRPATRP